ncbi:MAG: phosphatidylserine decarboxylase family protein [Candidatus Azobacteroides sp.]|nr:phosphatidylserine decarboxylase family protein [Candidatus Azobacteroides sp.]
MKIHKEGRKTVLIAFIFLILLNAGVYHFAADILIVFVILALSIGAFCCLLNFFRDSTCIHKEDTHNIVISPADGKIVVIEEVFEPEYFEAKRLQVSVFMNITDVHVNWVPVDGTVIHSSYQKGRFQAAYLPKSSAENERSSVVIERGNGDQILVRQIAGAMARRVVTYVQVGHPCHINEELGFIKFGSRVDLFLPLNADIRVKLDEKVRGNKTIIALLT